MRKRIRIEYKDGRVIEGGLVSIGVNEIPELYALVKTDSGERVNVLLNDEDIKEVTVFKKPSRFWTRFFSFLAGLNIGFAVNAVTQGDVLGATVHTFVMCFMGFLAYASGREGKQ